MPLFGPPNIEKLVSTGNINGLYKALGYDKDPAVRQAALRGLARLGHGSDALAKLNGIRDARAVAPLLAAAALGEPGWPKEASRQLVKIGIPAVEPLIAALTDRDESVREAAAKALGQIGDASAVAPLIAVLEGQCGDLAQYGDLSHVIRSLGQVCAQLGDADLTRRATASLRVAFENGPGGSSQRAYALQELTRLGQAPEAAQLFPILADKQETSVLRLAAIEALTGSGIEQSMKTLIAIVEDRAENVHVRQAAAVPLAKSGQREALSLLIAILQNQAEDHRLREAVLKELAKRGERETISSMIGILRDGSEKHLLRSAAAEALGNTGDAQAMMALIYAARYGDPEAKSGANKALEQVGPSAVRPLIAALSHEERAVREIAAKALVRLYRTFKLDIQSMKAIVEQRDRIIQPHRDSAHLDSGTHCVGDHTDQKASHRDSGIGVDFSLVPPRTGR